MQCADESTHTKPPSTRLKLHTKAVLARATHHSRQVSLHVYAKKDRVVHCDLSDKNADTKEIERVAVDAAAQMDEDDTLIWDRLGRIHQHFSPAVQRVLGRVARPGANDGFALARTTFVWSFIRVDGLRLRRFVCALQSS